MSFSPDSILERTRKNNKGKKEYWIIQWARLRKLLRAITETLGLFISESDVNSIEVTMKISLGAINEIIQSFRRYNYEIISEHQEDNY
jgi:N-acetyl-anhydromuramyl-L-alanine amidase AmpD